MKLAGWSCSDSFYSEAVISTAVAEPPFDNDLLVVVKMAAFYWAGAVK